VTDSLPSVYIVSGGAGASGEQLVHTVLAQFPDVQLPLVTVGYVRHVEQIEQVVANVAAGGGVIVHTLVDTHLRRTLIELAKAHSVAEVDLMGDLLAQLSQMLGMQPVGRPGLYRQLHQPYFDRVAAIEFSVAHDDGKRPGGWSLAEAVLVGVSRVGKTPLSMYLSVLGWKVANVPLVTEVEPPAQLFALDRRRVVGLTVEPAQLLVFRQQRQRRLGAPGRSAYNDPTAIYEELEAARRVFERSGFSVIDVTDKPIETSADEIISLITRRLGAG
jgi:regulator of PEP synthase PpsR (kinase-PPPase family)